MERIVGTSVSSSSSMEETSPSSSSTEETSPSSTELVLLGAQRDLGNTVENQPGFFLNPLCRLVKPLVDLAVMVLPPLAKTVPLLDPPLSFVLEIPVKAGHTVYQIVPPKAADEVRFKLSEIPAGIAFGMHSFIEFWSRPGHNLRLWKEYTSSLMTYCKSTGIDDEILQPLRFGYFSISLRILGSVQQAEDNTEIRRRKTAVSEEREVPSVAVVAKMMRYSCAAYGKGMMDSYDILVKKESFNLEERVTADLPALGGEDLKQQVCDHVGIPTDYISHFYLGAGGDLEVLRYYISVDHDLEAVVLVIRGTYSISQWHIDFQGQSKPFCDGEAHSGMADMATAIVTKSREEIIAGLKQNPSYKVMVTGQSLGGGVSPLVNMLLHVDPVIRKWNIECHAFAGPPVYYAESTPAIAAKAIANCTHYIHCDDTVPYLSVHQVRRFDAKLTALEDLASKISFVPSWLTAMGRKAPTSEMVDAALFGDADVEPVPGGPKLVMPAKEIVWFVMDTETEKVDYVVCDPEAFSELGIFVSGDTGMQHHEPQTYEYVLNKAEEFGWQIKTY